MALKGHIPWNKGKKVPASEATKKHLNKLIALKRARGYWHSEEWKKKMRGRKCSEETKKKISIANTGKKVSLETRNKIRLALVPWNKGKKGLQVGSWKGKKMPPRTEQWKIRQRFSQIGNRTGAKHHNWKGGITPIVEEIRKILKYRQWRCDVFERDNYTCTFCNKRDGGILHADHIKPFHKIIEENNIRSLVDAYNCEELWNLNNGRTLCIKCHKSTKTYGAKCQKYL